MIEEINKQTSGEAVISTGVGQHQMWAAQFYRWRRPRQMITSGGLGTMGYGLPSAMGAQLGAPGKVVIDIDGDASYLMTCYELATIAEISLHAFTRHQNQRAMYTRPMPAPSVRSSRNSPEIDVA